MKKTERTLDSASMHGGSYESSPSPDGHPKPLGREALLHALLPHGKHQNVQVKTGINGSKPLIDTLSPDERSRVNKLANQLEELLSSYEAKKDQSNHIRFDLDDLLCEHLNADSEQEVAVNIGNIIKSLDRILPQVNKFSIGWMYDDRLIQEDRFLNALAKNLGYFGGTDDDLEYVVICLYNKLNKLPSELIGAIVKRISPGNLSNILGFIVEYKSQNELSTYLELILKYNCPVNFLHFCSFKDKIGEKIDQVLELHTGSLFDIEQILQSTRNIEALGKYKQYLAQHPKKIVDSIIYDAFIVSDEDYFTIEDSSNYPQLSEFLDTLIRDIEREEGAEHNDITRPGQGTFSSAYLIGDKVLKVGHDRASKNFPNSQYILQPLLRHLATLDDKKLFFEVTQRADTDSYISDDELYELYAGLRDIGWVWLDADQANAGRLIEDNYVHWNKEGELISPSNETLGLLGEYGAKRPEVQHGEDAVAVRRKGEAIIIDADGIYRVDEEGSSIILPRKLSQEFGNRYEKEKIE